MAADIEREKTDIEKAQLIEEVMEKVLNYQQDMHSMLLAAKQEEQVCGWVGASVGGVGSGGVGERG